MSTGSTPEPSTPNTPDGVLAAMWSTRRPEVLADLDTLRQFVVDLAARCEDPDLPGRAVSLAHRLHGTMGIFGFSEARSLMAEAEAALRDRSTRDVAAIVAEVRRTLP
ncbi:MAG: Hpt domain-containing protein [Actinomycetota bacterium]